MISGSNVNKELDYTQCPVKECGITYATKFFTNDKINFICPCCGHEWSRK